MNNIQVLDSMANIYLFVKILTSICINILICHNKLMKKLNICNVYPSKKTAQLDVKISSNNVIKATRKMCL